MQPTIITTLSISTNEEFFDDLKRFKYVKRLINRYHEKGELAERLILNHLIVIFNVFGPEAGVEMLALKIPLEQWIRH